MKATIKPPHLPSNITSFTTAIPDNKVVGNTRYENLALSDEDWSEQTASGVVFDECHFQRMNLCGLQLPDLGLSDVLFGECDVANATWPNATLTRVEMVGCRLLGLRANEADVQHLVVKDCNLSLAQFRFATFKWVRFEHCNLHGADFHMADLRGAVFKGCDLGEAQMSSARLAKADFRGSNIDGLQTSPSDLHNLKGAIVEPFQAAYLAGLLGLQVKWSDTENE